MELNKESNAQLLTETKNLVAQLNEKTVEFLEHLREIDNRKLHLERGYTSLFSFVTEELGFSAGAAMRRINSMRLLKDLPEIKKQISSGVLNLTTLSQTQQLFKKETYSRESKLKLLVTLEDKSTREVDRELAKYSPLVRTFDRMKPVSFNQSEVKFIADDELVNKLEKLKALKSHSIKNLSDLITAMADLCLDKWELKPKKSSGQRNQCKINEEPKELIEIQKQLDGPPTPAPERYVSKKLKSDIYTRDLGRCQYTDLVSGKKCHSKHFIQLDHIEPFALGGLTTEKNLRLYCSAHNQLRGQKTFGRVRRPYEKNSI